MFDGLFKSDDSKGDVVGAYKVGRDGKEDVLGSDTKDEQEARERGQQDRINAEETRKENEEAENKKDK